MWWAPGVASQPWQQTRRPHLTGKTFLIYFSKAVMQTECNEHSCSPSQASYAPGLAFALDANKASFTASRRCIAALPGCNPIVNLALQKESVRGQSLSPLKSSLKSSLKVLP
ncbi:unnamed protein product [Effrenium voratum]|uniref:Uncharacterized protein n=1 Tax=Effrenium voratum TaxID=2562239 RepID=A0AA36NG75_9DINO|nr:unnamed protein product [Effrenium voratum]CAJ1440097.1 unnamed protein product [Effrenium voratum]